MTSITQISRHLKSVLTESAQRASAAVALVQRQRQVSSTNLVQTLVLGWWHNPDISLEGLTQFGKSVNLSISAQGLDQRLNETTANYLKAVLDEVVAVKIRNHKLILPGMDHFSHVYVEDSSTVTFQDDIEDVWQGLGGKGPTSSVKLQTRLDLKQGNLDGPHLADGRTHDKKAALAHCAIETNALLLRDLGYWKLTDWTKANAEGHFLLSYFKMSTHFWHQGKAYDAYNWCQMVQGNEFDVDIELGKYEKAPTRLLGKRTSRVIAAKRRRKLKRAAKERGQTISPKRLALCEWTILATNIPRELMTNRDAFLWIGVRWQIELLFKLWKSVGKIDKSRSNKPWRQLCEFYAKVIAMTVQHWLFMPTIWHIPDRSWTKAAMQMRVHVIRIATALNSQSALTKIIRELQSIFSSGCRINRSRKQTRTFQVFEKLAVNMA